MMMWYPDSGATSHITSLEDNIKYPRQYTGKDCIYTADGTPLPITKSGRSVAKINESSLVLHDLCPLQLEIYVQ